MESINIGDYVRYTSKQGAEIHRVERIVSGVPILDNGYVCTADSIEKTSAFEAFTDEFHKLLLKYCAKIAYGMVDKPEDGDRFMFTATVEKK